MAKVKIKLIVTGMMEKEGLHESLRRWFDGTDVFGNEVVWEMPRKEHGATGNRIKVGPNPRPDMRALARSMIAETFTSKVKGQAPADFVVVIDDIELANLGQTHIVLDEFKRAVSYELSLRAAGDVKRLAAESNIVRAKCSFHLFSPMVESYLLMDPSALSEISLSPLTSFQITHLTDAEQFLVCDQHPDWIGKSSAKDIAMASHSPWWKSAAHPKFYLDHLLQASGVEYQETRQGKAALLRTDWSAVAKLNTDAPVISALLADLWECLGLAIPAGKFVGVPCPQLFRNKAPAGQRTLRNI